MVQTNRCYRGVATVTRAAAGELRARETPAERLLWSALRRKRIHGIKFRHQHAIGRFVLDFYTVEFRLAIELDGDAHVFREEYDAERTRYLKSVGIQVVRFQNEDVLYRLNFVLNEISKYCIIGAR